MPCTDTIRTDTALYYTVRHCAVIADDLKHMSQVNFDVHSRFAVENEMSSFLISAKSGDQVRQAFTKIAASLAGRGHSSDGMGWDRVNILSTLLILTLYFPRHLSPSITPSHAPSRFPRSSSHLLSSGVYMSKADLESRAPVIPAQIVNHTR